MSTKLIPVHNEPVRWQFPEDMGDKSACIFYIKLRTNRDRLESQLKKTAKLITDVDDLALDIYQHISKIENADGKTLTQQNEIIEFCLDRLSEPQGSQLALAIQNVGTFLSEGLIKN